MAEENICLWAFYMVHFRSSSVLTGVLGFIVVDYFTGWSDLENSSTGDILYLLGKGLGRALSHKTDTHTYIHKDISKRGLYQIGEGDTDL